MEIPSRTNIRTTMETWLFMMRSWLSNGSGKSMRSRHYMVHIFLTCICFRRNIRHFGGDPDKITLGGASAGAGLVSLVSSLESVGPYIKGVIQQSGDALGPTTGFMPPTEVKF